MIAARAFFGYPNRLVSGVYSGGAWKATLPLSNLTYRRKSKVARSVSAAPRETWFYVDAGSSIECGSAMLSGHDLTVAGKWRLRGFGVDPRGVVDAVFTGDALPAGWSVARASTAWYFDRDGLLKAAGNNVARIEWINGVRMGLLLEADRTNSLLRSRDVSNATWTKTVLTVSQTVTGLDGVTNSAGRLTAVGANGQAIQAVGALGGVAVVFSVYVRRVTGTGQVLLSVDNFTTSTNIGGSLTSSWQRFQIAGTMNGLGQCGIRLATNGDAIEVDCFQLEAVAAGASASSPIITTTVGVARFADQLTYTPSGAAFAGGAMLLTAGLVSRPTATTDLAVATNGGTSAVGFTMTSAGVPTGTYRNAGAEQLSGITGSAVTAGNEFSAAISWAANDVRASFGAAAVVSDATVTVPAVSMTTLQLNPQQNLGLYLRRLKLYPATKTNAQLQALSGADQEVAADADSGWLDAWPAAWVAATTAEEQAEWLGRGESPYFPNAPYASHRYWRVDVDDNSGSYKQIGRLLISGGWQPAVNMAEGAQIGITDRDLVNVTDSGAKSFKHRAGPLFQRFSIDVLQDADLYRQVLRMQMAGSSGELIFSRDPTDLTYRPWHTWTCTMRQLSPAETPYFNEHQVGFELEQSL